MHYIGCKKIRVTRINQPSLARLQALGFTVELVIGPASHDKYFQHQRANRALKLGVKK